MSTRSKELRTLPRGRVPLGLFGLVAFASGVVAVFVSSNNIGTVALLAIGAGLVAVAALGLSPKSVKVGDNEVQFGEVLYAEKTRDLMAEIVVDKDLPRENRESISELIVEMNRRFNDQGGLIPLSANKLALNAYMVAVQGALRRVLPRECSIVEFTDEDEFTFLLQGCSVGDVYVDCAFGRQNPMPAEIYRHYASRAMELPTLLVITNRPPVGELYEEVTRQGFRQYSPVSTSPKLVIARWTGTEDDDELQRAANGILGSRPHSDQ
jgi:hypothetical protein